MVQYTLYVGLNDKDSKVQEISTVEAFKILTKLCGQYTSGATIFDADGVYKHDDGTVVIEKSFKIELLFITKEQVKEIANMIKKIFNQESIALTTREVESELI